MDIIALCVVIFYYKNLRNALKYELKGVIRPLPGKLFEQYVTIEIFLLNQRLKTLIFLKVIEMQSIEIMRVFF
jgi:hypothetical protein